MGGGSSRQRRTRTVSPDPAYASTAAEDGPSTSSAASAAAAAAANPDSCVGAPRMQSRAISMPSTPSPDLRAKFQRRVSADCGAVAVSNHPLSGGAASAAATASSTAVSTAARTSAGTHHAVQLSHFRPTAIMTLPRSLSVPASVKRASLSHYAADDDRYDAGSDDGNDCRLAARDMRVVSDANVAALPNVSRSDGLSLSREMDESESPPRNRRAGSDSPSRRRGRGGFGGGFGASARAASHRLDAAPAVPNAANAAAASSTVQIQTAMAPAPARLDLNVVDQQTQQQRQQNSNLTGDELAALAERGEEVPRTPTSLSTFRSRGDEYHLDAAQAQLFAEQMVRSGIRLLAVDFDKTLVGVHTRARWREGPAALAQTVRPIFRTLIPAVLATSRIHVSIVTFSKQDQLIRDALVLTFGDALAARILVRSDRTPGLSKRERGSAWETGKQWHLLSALQEIGMCSSSPRGWGDVARTLTGDAAKSAAAPVRKGKGKTGGDSGGKGKWGGAADSVEEEGEGGGEGGGGGGGAGASAAGEGAEEGEPDEAMRELMRGIVMVDDDMRNIRLAVRFGAVALGFTSSAQLHEDLLKRFSRASATGSSSSP